MTAPNTPLADQIKQAIVNPSSIVARKNCERCGDPDENFPKWAARAVLEVIAEPLGELNRLRATVAEVAALTRNIDGEAINDDAEIPVGEIYRALHEYETDRDPMYLVWSNAAGAWWRPNESGYCQDDRRAGRYSRATAVKICRTRTWESGSRPPEVAVLAPEYWQIPPGPADDVASRLRGEVEQETRERIAKRDATHEFADGS